MEEIVAVAMKNLKTEEVYVSRNSHSELIIMFPDIFKKCEQGFLTSKCRFVDRKEALKIAKKYKQITYKCVDNDELYSEDIFLNRKENTDVK